MAKRKSTRQRQRNAMSAITRARPSAIRSAPSGYAGPAFLPVATAPRAPRTRQNGNGAAMAWNLASALAGGLAGAGLAAGLYAAGIGPYWAGGVTATAGSGMALLLNGKARWFGAGLAAAGGAQLGVTYFSHRAIQKAQAQPGDRRSAGGGLSPAEVLEAFARARQAAAYSAPSSEAAHAQARAQAEAAMRAADAQVAAMQAAMQAQQMRNAAGGGVVDDNQAQPVASPSPGAVPVEGQVIG